MEKRVRFLPFHPVHLAGIAAAALVLGSPGPLTAAIRLRIDQTECLGAGGEPAIQVGVEKNAIVIRRLSALINCCHVADALLKMEDGRIEVQERNAGSICRCLCPFDLTYTIAGLFPGVYDLILLGEDGSRLAAETVAVEPPAWQSLCREEIPDPPSVKIVAERDRIRIEHRNAREQCCLQLAAAVEVNKGTLRIFELDRSPAPCFCLCYFDLTMEVPGLGPGIYPVEIYDLRGDLIAEETVLIDTPRLIATQSRCLERPPGDPPEESIAISADCRRISIERRQALEQCCLELDSSAAFSHSAVMVQPVDLGPPCDCICRFNLRHEVLDVLPGSYHVELLNWAGLPVAKKDLGVCEGLSFIRGAASSEDWNVDISDPVAVLHYIFLGRGSIPCLDAADGNDDGSLDVSDPIYVLTFLFLGGPEPPAPFPSPGFDPTPDSLRCESVPCREEKLLYELEPERRWDFVEFCIPVGEEFSARVAALYSEASFLPGSSGRIGCNAKEEVLVIIDWAHVDRGKMCRLSLLPFIGEIRGSHWE